MRPTRREVLAVVALGLLASASYLVIGRVSHAPVAVVMPGWVPFLPSLAVPYLLQVVVSYYLVLAVRDRTLRHATMKAYFASYAVTCLAWLAYPTVMHRPLEVPGGWWNGPYRVMASLDLPTNIAPAGHILMPVLICWAFAYDRPRWLWWLVPAEVLGMVAIATTWQHRPVDIAVGIALALAAGLLFGIGRRRAAAPTEPGPPSAGSPASCRGCAS